MESDILLILEVKDIILWKYIHHVFEVFEAERSNLLIFEQDNIFYKDLN